MTAHPKPPFPSQEQPVPGETGRMDPRPDHGEASYRGSGRLTGLVALITGADSGIGRAVALAYAREGADVLFCYLSEDEDAEATRRLVEEAGRRAVAVRCDIADPQTCRGLVDRCMDEFGRLDVLVNNAAHQARFGDIAEISDAEWRLTFAVNVDAMFYLTRAAAAVMPRGGSIINTASINSDDPNPHLLAYATTKGAIRNFTAGAAQLLAAKGIRVNCVAPGPIWTPLIPSTMGEAALTFGADTPMQRPGQPAELATAFVMLADPLSSYTSGATVAVTGGRPML